MGNHNTFDPKRAHGSNARPLLQREIEHAHANTHSKLEAARFLNVSYRTYEKYAKMYGLWGYFTHRGRPKGSKGKRLDGAYGLNEILSGKYPGYDRSKLKDRLIAAGLIKQECALCRFNEKRAVDGRTPLVLDHMDDNRNNFNLDNLRVLCYNCAYLTRGVVTMAGFQRMQKNNVTDKDLMEVHKVTEDDLEALRREIEQEMAEDENAR